MADYGGRRPASNPPESRYLRHNLGRKLEAWRAVGAEPRVLSWIENDVHIPFRHGPPLPFHHGVSMLDATPAQMEFLSEELPRFYASGAFEDGYCNQWVSRMFLVPKPGINRWRVIIDLRYLNKHCKIFNLKL